MGWAGSGAGQWKTAIAIVPGSHYTLLVPPNVAVLAAQLDQLLAAVQQG